MTDRLLDRQIELLDYLASGNAIFGAGREADRSPHGFDRRLLRLEATMSYGKRLEKIVAAFARTFEILGAAGGPLLRDFAEACPPTSIGRIDNARQFHDFLAARWRDEPPASAHLIDVAACELTCAEAAAVAGGRMGRGQGAEFDVRKPIHRAPGVVLLRCAYDIRPLFEQGPTAGVPMAKDTPLAVVVRRGENRPQIFELPPAVFELLAALDNPVDPAVFATTAERERLIAELFAGGLLEQAP